MNDLLAQTKWFETFPASLHPEHAFPHAAPDLRLLETHISWVILTGPFAYKIRKPVSFDFLDFSTPEKRREDCERELRINQAFAPEIYLEVVPITWSKSGLAVAGPGEVVDHAVKMRQFPQSALLVEQLNQGHLSPTELPRLADQIAAYHLAARIVARESQPDWEALIDPIRANFDYFAKHAPASFRKRIMTLRQWTESQLVTTRDRLEARTREGFIRECHGDLHLGNLLYWEDRFLAFDAIEFNEAFRHIDTLNEIAFLVMDLEDRGYRAESMQVLNRYLEHTGDYRDLSLLRLDLVYRALVRAKVDLIQQEQHAADDSRHFSSEGERYIKLAEQYAFPSPPTLAITHGVSGSGKSTGARTWSAQQHALHFRSDILRQQLVPLLRDEDNAELSQLTIYGSPMSEKTYETLAELAAGALDAGFSVVVDATFLKQAQRQRFQALATQRKIAFQILVFSGERDELARRIEQRTNDPSEATVEVLDRQLQAREPLTPAEQALAHSF